MTTVKKLLLIKLFILYKKAKNLTKKLKFIFI